MTNSRLFGRHYHRTSQLIGPDTPPGGGGGISGLVQYFENADAGDLEYGDVVRIDTSGDSLVEKTTTLDDGLVLGIVAAAGPFAPGAQTPVLTVGYHPAINITGSGSVGDFLTASATDGTVEASANPSSGTFARAVADEAGGAIAGVLLGIGIGGAASIQIEETSGPTVLDIGAIADGEYLKRSGTDIVGDTPAGGGGGSGYDPDEPPISPNSMDDEFNDDTGMSGSVNGLNARWAWRNQGTTVISWPATGGITLTPPASATRNIRILEQAEPAAQNYTIQAKLGLTHTGANFAQVAMVVIDGTNGDFYWMPIAVQNGNSRATAVNYMTNVTTFSSTPLAGGVWGQNWAYFKIDYVHSTTTYTFSISEDRKNWYRLGSVVDTIGANKVGFGIDEETNTGFPAANVQWFRRTA